MSDHVRLVLCTPADDLNPWVASEILLAFWNLNLSLILDIHARSSSIEVAVICQRRYQGLIERALRGASSQIDIDVSDHQELPQYAFHLTSSLDQGDRLKFAPLKSIHEFAKEQIDPLHSLLESVMPLADDEEFHFYLALRPLPPERREEIAKRLYTKPNWFNRFLFRIPDVDFPVYPDQMQKAFEERLFGQPCFEMLGLLSLSGNHLPSLRSRAYSLSSMLVNRFYAGYGSLQPSDWTTSTVARLPTLNRLPDSDWLLIAAAEAAALWHPLSSQVTVPGVTFLKYPTIQLPQTVLEAQGITLGTYRYRGKDVAINLPFQDLHTTHFSIPAGQTGMGKSTTFTHMAAQLLRSKDRPSLISIDPHGTLNTSIALRVIPDQRISQTYLFELGDVERPVGIPIFRKPAKLSLDAFIQATYSLFALIFKAQWSETRMADAIHSLTTTLCTVPNSSLLDAPKLLADPAFRRRKLALIDDPVTLEFWDWYESQSEGVKRQIASPIVSRLRSLFRARAVRNLLCQYEGIDWGQLIGEGANILVSLSGAEILAEANTLGETIIAQLQLEVMSRLDPSYGALRRTYIMIDESQRYKGDSLRVILSEARKVDATLLLSTQYMSQWDENIKSAVLGNVGNKLCFRCGPEDSVPLSRSFRPFTSDQLEHLDQHECVCSLQIAQQKIPTFAFRALDYQQLNSQFPERPEVLEQIRQQTKDRFTKPRDQVEELLGLKKNGRPLEPEGLTYDLDEDEV